MYENVLNICASKELKSLLANENEKWVSFNERMIEGKYTKPLFSEGFCAERSKTLDMSLDEYKKMMSEYLDELPRLDNYDCIKIWYYSEESSLKNAYAIFGYLESHLYSKKIITNELDKETNEIIMRMANFKIENEQD